MEYEQIQNRRKSIVSLLKMNNFLTVEEVCRQLKITDSTARRDIKWLENQNLILRFHGGISLIDNQYNVFNIRNKTNLDLKKKIAKKAASLVCDSDILFIGGGSTMFQFSKELILRAELKNVLIVTATFNVAALFAEKPNFSTIILGGSLKKTDETIASRMTIDNAKTINYTKVFNGAMGVSVDMGVTQPTASLAELEMTIMTRSIHNFLVVDHTKFKSVGLYTSYDIDRIYKIITDRHPSIDELIRAHGEYENKIIQV